MVPDDYDEVDERVTTEQPAATTASITPRKIVYRTFDQLIISQSAHNDISGETMGVWVRRL